MPTRPASYTPVPSMTGPSPWTLLNASGQPVEPVSRFLVHLLACDSSPATLRSCAYDLLDWFRLTSLERPWADARQRDVREYVLALRTRPNPQRKHGPRPPNLRTGKPYLAPGYAPTTIHHRLTVLHAFYAFHRQEGQATGHNPVPDGARECHTLAHRSPLAPTPESRRALYRQQGPTRLPRAPSDDLWDEVFRTLTSHRDRPLACRSSPAPPAPRKPSTCWCRTWTGATRGSG